MSSEYDTSMEHRFDKLEAGQQVMSLNMEHGFQSVNRRLDILNGSTAETKREVRELQNTEQRELGMLEGRTVLRRRDYTVIGLMLTAGGILVGGVFSLLAALSR